MNKIKLLIIIIIVLILIGVIGLLGINFYVKSVASKCIEDDISNIKDKDVILVLGCEVHEDGTLSLMLKDRLDKVVELYKLGVSNKIIVSGDHGTTKYDEVNAMKDYLINNGIKSEDIFMDHAGFSTYESLYRARDIFEVKSLIVVTQKYHLYRAVYIGKKLGLDVTGVYAKEIKYVGQEKRDIREIFARDKDFIKCIFKPKPTYLGDTIPVSGNGDVTNDK